MAPKARQPDPQSDQQITRALSLGLAALIEKAREDWATLHSETQEWFGEERVSLVYRQFKDAIISYEFGSVDEPPARLSVLTSSVIHTICMIYEHVARQKRRSLVSPSDGVLPEGTAHLFRRWDNLAKHELLPILLMGTNHPRVDVIDPPTQQVIGELSIDKHNAVAQAGKLFILTHSIPAKFLPGPIEFGVAIVPELALCHPDDDRLCFAIEDILSQVIDLATTYCLPFIDWLSSHEGAGP